MCHSRHYHHRAVERPAEQAPPRDPALRASDAERESTVTQLREHGGAGRLDVEELEQRVAAAYGARTHGELETVLSDLPGTVRATPARPARSPHRHGHGHGPGGFLPVIALLIAIWAITGAGYFWPAWVIVWWGFALVMKSGPRLLRLR